MSSGIELEGFDEFLSFTDDMTLTDAEERKAVRVGIEYIAQNLEKDSPKGYTGKLSKIKTTIKQDGLGISGEARAGAFWDAFQEFGTSTQKANVGYFEKSIDNSKDHAFDLVAEEVFKNIK